MSTDTLTTDEQSKWREWLPLIVVIALAAAAALYIASHVAAVSDFISNIGVLGPILSITLQTVFGASPIPTEPLTMINGAVFGALRGAFYSWIGYMLASLIEYYLGTRIGEVADFEDRREHLPFGLSRFPADSPFFLIVVRVIPGYGPKMVGVVGGMYRVSLWRFMWTAAIPNAIGALAFAYGGHGLMTLIH